MNSTTNPIGLTKREHFAALILAAMASNPDFTKSLTIPAMTGYAISQADFLIETLNGGPKSSDPEDLASEARWQEDKAIDDFNHREFYRPLYSTELVQIPESPELDELRNELYSEEILLGGGE